VHHRQQRLAATPVPAALLQSGNIAMSTATKLRLGPLPNTQSIKMPFTCLSNLKTTSTTTHKPAKTLKISFSRKNN